MYEPKLKDLILVVEKVLKWTLDSKENVYKRKHNTYCLQLAYNTSDHKTRKLICSSSGEYFLPQMTDSQAQALLDAITQEFALVVVYKPGYECAVYLPAKDKPISKGNFNEAVTKAAIWLVKNGYLDD